MDDKKDTETIIKELKKITRELKTKVKEEPKNLTSKRKSVGIKIDDDFKAEVIKYNGKKWVDIRKYKCFKNSDIIYHTKKGITLSAIQWERLKDFIHEIDNALLDLDD